MTITEFAVGEWTLVRHPIHVLSESTLTFNSEEN